MVANETSQSPLVVEAKDIAKRYGRIIALAGVTFELKMGQAMALWGPNGAGKSTLIKAILGLVDYQGELSVSGYDVRRQGKLARSQIGYVPQEAIFYDMRLRATMAFYGCLRNTNPERIPVLLERLGLVEHADKRVSALSGGLKQRLALALALLSDPPLLLLDEPTANLDVQARRDYLALLAELRDEGKTILFASHRLEDVELLAQHVLALEAGKVAAELTPGELRRVLSPQVELTLWIAEGQRLAALSLLQGEGLAGHLNGRGTVVMQVSPAQKLRALELLNLNGIEILDFEMDRGETWS